MNYENYAGGISMTTKISGWRAMIIILATILTLSCALPLSLQRALSPSSTPTTSPALNIGGGIVQNGNGNGGAGNGQGGSAGSGGSGGGFGNGSNSQVGVTPNPNHLPYVVKQIVSLGHETISGQVCNLTQKFTVNAVAPEVSWNFIYNPSDAGQGSWVYAYSIPKAGETHDAAGSYKISQVSSDGTLRLTMTGSDKVAFKGFAGTIPVNYYYNLVPSQNTACPNTP
jgi:hypothetical protein